MGICVEDQVLRAPIGLWGHPVQDAVRAGWSARRGAAGPEGCLGLQGSDVLSGSSGGSWAVGLWAVVGSLRLRACAAEEGAPQHGQTS